MKPLHEIKFPQTTKWWETTLLNSVIDSLSFNTFNNSIYNINYEELVQPLRGYIVSMELTASNLQSFYRQWQGLSINDV
jgi:hypothetical protein